jgi:hypothetical protein
MGVGAGMEGGGRGGFVGALKVRRLGCEMLQRSRDACPVGYLYDVCSAAAIFARWLKSSALSRLWCAFCLYLWKWGVQVLRHRS